MIERYTHEKHGSLVYAWLSSRGIAVPQQELIYDTGFVVDGIAIGFLCKTNSKTAFIDQVVTKPGLPEQAREAALATLIDRLESEARKEGFWQIAALAGQFGMINRFTEQGFTSGSRYTLVHKPLISQTESKLCHG